jgi:hypothetical protein
MCTEEPEILAKSTQVSKAFGASFSVRLLQPEVAEYITVTRVAVFIDSTTLKN